MVHRVTVKLAHSISRAAPTGCTRPAAGLAIHKQANGTRRQRQRLQQGLYRGPPCGACQLEWLAEGEGVEAQAAAQRHLQAQARRQLDLVWRVQRAR
jgi:hypothetical protein